MKYIFIIIYNLFFPQGCKVSLTIHQHAEDNNSYYQYNKSKCSQLACRFNENLKLEWYMCKFTCLFARLSQLCCVSFMKIIPIYPIYKLHFPRLCSFSPHSRSGVKVYFMQTNLCGASATASNLGPSGRACHRT